MESESSLNYNHTDNQNETIDWIKPQQHFVQVYVKTLNYLEAEQRYPAAFAMPYISTQMVERRA